MLNQPNPEIPPRYMACLIDISEHCEPALLERCGGKLFYSGFFDDSVNTHCCSLTPSVYVDVIELVPESAPEGEEARTALFEELLELHTIEDSGYYGRSAIERLKEKHPERVKTLEFDFDEDDDRDEVVREHLQGNPEF